MSTKRIVKFTKQEQIKLVALQGTWVGGYFYRLFFNRANGKFVVFEEEKNNLGYKILLPVNTSMIDIVNARLNSINCLNLTLSEANEVEHTVENVASEIEILATAVSDGGTLVYACCKDLSTGEIGLYFKGIGQDDTSFGLGNINGPVKVKVANSLLTDLVTNMEAN